MHSLDEKRRAAATENYSSTVPAPSIAGLPLGRDVTPRALDAPDCLTPWRCGYQQAQRGQSRDDADWLALH
jgi:hypothetical protein